MLDGPSLHIERSAEGPVGLLGQEPMDLDDVDAAGIGADQVALVGQLGAPRPARGAIAAAAVSVAGQEPAPPHLGLGLGRAAPDDLDADVIRTRVEVGLDPPGDVVDVTPGDDGVDQPVAQARARSSSV